MRPPRRQLCLRPPPRIRVTKPGLLNVLKGLKLLIRYRLRRAAPAAGKMRHGRMVMLLRSNLASRTKLAKPRSSLHARPAILTSCRQCAGKALLDAKSTLGDARDVIWS